MGAVELIAHRAGNEHPLIEPALAVADAIELDVHTFRGRIEVRHSKALWPFAVYWERGVGVLPGEDPLPFASILAALPGGAHLWVDLKGFTGRFTERVLGELGDRRPLTMSSRSWWTLRPARRRVDVRTFRSVANRFQLWLALRLTHPDGIVMHERFATPEHLDRLRRRCESLAVWAVDDLDRAVELLDLGVTALIIDDVDLIDAIGRDRA